MNVEIVDDQHTLLTKVELDVVPRIGEHILLREEGDRPTKLKVTAVLYIIDHSEISPLSPQPPTAKVVTQPFK